MNIFEVFALVFIALVIINVASMIWAIKKAELYESISINADQET